MRIKVTGSFEIDKAFEKNHKDAFKNSLEQTAEQLKTDLILAQTVPFDTGMLQNNKMFIDYNEVADGKIALKFEGPYARRLYFNPQFNFQQDKNPNAGGRWLDPYLKGGEKQDFAVDTFMKLYAENMGL